MDNKKYSGLSVVVFGYNEAGTLLKTIENSLKVLQKITYDAELIVVDDGSTDYTSHILEQLKTHPLIKVYRFEENKGIGEALKKGYSLVSKKFVCAIPADGQFDMSELLKIPIAHTNTIISFRRQSNQVYGIGRKLLTYSNRLFNRYFLELDVSDINWIKIYPVYPLKQLKLECTTSIVETEICAKLNLLGLKFVEIPSHYFPRTSGDSKSASPFSVLKVLMELRKLYTTVKVFKKEVSANSDLLASSIAGNSTEIR